MPNLKCPVCGTESLTTVVSRIHEGALQQVCLECERRRRAQERSGVRQIASGTARLLIYGGILLTLLTLTVDELSLSGQTGFGWRQITGAEMGLLGVVLGFLVGRGLLGIAGLFLLVLSLGADLLHVGHAPGLGWRSNAALALASVLLALGLLWQYVLRRREASLDVNQHEQTRDSQGDKPAHHGGAASSF